MFRTVLVVAAASGILSGCATTAQVPITSALSRQTNPQIGVLTTKEVGEALFAVEVARTFEGMSFPEGTRVGNNAATFEPKGSFLLTNKTATDATYCGAATQVGGLGGAPVRKEFPHWCFARSALDKMGVSYTLGKVSKVDPENLRRELLYQGKSGQQLRISYREFAGDLARPAFTQDLTFDLSEGKVIGAKGARLEVIKASNVSITYRVLQPFTT